MNTVRSYHKYGNMILAVLALFLCLVAGGCSGITPDGELRNNREEGPEKGLFSGPDGEFILLGPARDEPPAEKEAQPEASQ